MLQHVKWLTVSHRLITVGDTYSEQEVNNQSPPQHQNWNRERGAWPKMSDAKTWKELDEYASEVIRKSLRGAVTQRIKQLPKLLHAVCVEQFGVVQHKGNKCTRLMKQAARRQVAKGRL